MPKNKFSTLGCVIIIHPRHLEVRTGTVPYVKKDLIPYRNISSVSVTKFTKKLVIQTNDGKTQKHAIGGFGKAQKCRDAIIAAINAAPVGASG